MVVGKSLILLAVSFSSLAVAVDDPKFFSYRSGGFQNRLVDFSFGWFRTLDPVQKETYNAALNQAVMYADNGKTVRWYESDASGEVTPVITWQRGNGYCRRMHIQAIAHGVEKTMSATACFDDVNDRWQWFNDK